MWNRPEIFARNNGFSLIEALVAMAIMAIITMGFMTLMSAMQKETRSMQDQVERVDAQEQFMQIMGVNSLCGCQFYVAAPGGGLGTYLVPPIAADPDQPGTFFTPLSKITMVCNDPTKVFAEAGTVITGAGRNFKVLRVIARNLKPLGPPNLNQTQDYAGSLMIDLDSAGSSTGRSMRGLKVSKIFSVDTTTNQIISCGKGALTYESIPVNNLNLTDSQEAFAQCDQGETILSGGWATDSLSSSSSCADHAVTESRPKYSPLNGGIWGWAVIAKCQTFRAKALCKPGS